VSFTGGLIAVSETSRLKKLLFRATHGNALVNLYPVEDIRNESG
jgi:hypothetical protein